MKWLIAIFSVLALYCIASAEDVDFAKRVAEFNPKGKAQCRCGGDPSLCSCYVCECAGGGDCRAKAKKLPKAPLLYKHVCGCPSMSCNCAPLGGCHCSENAMFNRVNPTWQASPAGGYSLWRGNDQLGYYDGKTYWPLHNGEWCEPTKAPIPLPRQQSSAQPVQVSAAPVCRS